MSQDYFSIGPTPAGEQCAQVGEPDYKERAIAECQRFGKLIKKRFGTPPGSAKVAIMGQPHDFGTYYEVVVLFDADDEKAIEWAYHVENEAPMTWEDDSEDIPIIEE